MGGSRGELSAYRPPMILLLHRPPDRGLPPASRASLLESHCALPPAGTSSRSRPTRARLGSAPSRCCTLRHCEGKKKGGPHACKQRCCGRISQVAGRNPKPTPSAPVRNGHRGLFGGEQDPRMQTPLGSSRPSEQTFRFPQK